MTEWRENTHPDDRVDDPAVERWFKALPRTGPSKETLETISRAALQMAAQRVDQSRRETAWERIREFTAWPTSRYTPVLAATLAMVMFLYVGYAVLPGSSQTAVTGFTTELAATTVNWDDTSSELDVLLEQIEGSDGLQTLISSQEADGGLETELMSVSEDIVTLTAEISEF
jgi:hypothetical protein